MAGWLAVRASDVHSSNHCAVRTVAKASGSGQLARLCTSQPHLPGPFSASVPCVCFLHSAHFQDLWHRCFLEGMQFLNCQSARLLVLSPCPPPPPPPPPSSLHYPHGGLVAFSPCQSLLCSQDDSFQIECSCLVGWLVGWLSCLLAG